MNEEELYKLAGYTLKKWNMPYDEDLIQDLVFKGYQCIEKYDESKGALSTFIINTMQNRIKEMNRHRKMKGRDTQVLSLDYIVDSDENKEFSYFISDDVDAYDVINRKNILEQIAPLVETPLKLYINGYTLREIAERYNLSQEAINKRIKANIKRIKDFVEEKGLIL